MILFWVSSKRCAMSMRVKMQSTVPFPSQNSYTKYLTKYHCYCHIFSSEDMCFSTVSQWSNCNQRKGQKNLMLKSPSWEASRTHISGISYVFRTKFYYRIYNSPGPYSESAESSPHHQIQNFQRAFKYYPQNSRNILNSVSFRVSNLNFVYTKKQYRAHLITVFITTWNIIN